MTSCLESVTVRSRGLAASRSSCRARLYSRGLTYSCLTGKETSEATWRTQWIGSTVTGDCVLGQVDRYEPPTGQLKSPHPIPVDEPQMASDKTNDPAESFACTASDEVKQDQCEWVY